LPLSVARGCGQGSTREKKAGLLLSKGEPGGRTCFSPKENLGKGASGVREKYALFRL